MAIQLPQQELGTAVGVLVYSVFCLACSFVMAWLTYAHHEALSYVAILSYITGLSTSSSIAQQIHTIMRWRDNKIEQFQHTAANPGNPELTISGESAGLDLVLFYIQYYCYNVAAALTFFWAVALTKSILQLKSLKSGGRQTNYGAKATSVLLPALLVGVLRLQVVQNHPVVFLLLADSIIGFCVSGSGILLVVILAKYVDTRRNLQSWNVHYGQQSNNVTTDGTTIETSEESGRQSIYDNWLVVRFSIAFMALSVFQVLSILFEIFSAEQKKRTSQREGPDLSIDRAHLDLILFLPGVSIGLLDFIVFGTTKAFREYLAAKLMPQWLRGSSRKIQNSARRTRVFPQRRTPHTPDTSPDTSGDNVIGSRRTGGGENNIQLFELDASSSRKPFEPDASGSRKYFERDAGSLKQPFELDAGSSRKPCEDDERPLVPSSGDQAMVGY